MIFHRKKNQKKIFLFGKFFTIRKLVPFDFLEMGGLPLSMFVMTQDGGKDAASSIFKAIKTEEEKKKDKETQRETVKKILTIGVLNKGFKPGSLKWEQAFMLYAVILDFSLSKIKRLFEIEKNRVIVLDAMAKRYGITPLEFVAPGEKFSPLETYMFNEFIAIHAMVNEVEIHNKQIEEQKALQRKAGRR